MARSAITSSPVHRGNERKITLAGYKLYSADSHVSEPADLWVKRLDQKWRFRAPKVETLERDGTLADYLIYEGYPPHPVAVGIAAAVKTGDKDDKFEFVKTRAGRYAEALAGGWDPVARLKDQDIDGVVGEVLHPTLGFRMFWLHDGGLQQAVFRAYNDWLAEFVSYNPQRLVGVALISLFDVDAGCQELRRAANLGLKGAMIALSPPPECPPYDSPVYDPFWAEAQELQMPVVLHAITGGGESRLLASYWIPDTIIGNVISHHEAERTFSKLILYGVLERFPRLQIISAENGMFWMPYFFERLDRQLRNGLIAGLLPKLSIKPSEYFQRQIAVGFITDKEAVPLRHLIGVDNLMWASDYPHSASTWPKSQDVVAELTEGITDDERQKLVHDNVLRLYRIAQPAMA
jgi:predicted TIM-barrel fold metal-dependent hydrolase